MFQITEFVEARLASVTNRVEKHGDDDQPAVSIAVEITAANTLLDCIDPTLRHALYKAVEDQPQLPGVEQSTPVLRCNSIDRVILPSKYEGWTMEVDDGVDETEPAVFGGSKVDKMSVEPKQGGSIVLRMRIGSSDLDAERSGMLGMHVGQSIWIKLLAPQKQPDAIDGTSAAFDADHPKEPDATDMFASDGAIDTPGGSQGDPDSDEDEDSEGGATDLEERFDNALARADAAPPASAGKRTARGRERMRKALAEGAAS